MTNRFLSGIIYALSGLIGIAAFVYPFLQLAIATSRNPELTSTSLLSAPLLTSLLLVICLLALLVEMQGEATSAKVVAALGMMVAAASVLRFIETAIPGPGGFSPVFVPIILAGYVFGVRFGFLMGTFTILVSALVTGGVGPWLPYQMFVAGWVGFTAGCLPHLKRPRLELGLLVFFGLFWGLFYGLLTNLYFWPFFAGEVAMSWQPGLGLGKGLRHYIAFYVATSLLWDIGRAAGNGVLLLALGLPTVRALTRFRDRFQFTHETNVEAVQV